MDIGRPGTRLKRLSIILRIINKMITELETKLQETIENAMTQAHTLRVINNGLEAENIRLKMSIEFGLKEFAKRCNAMESDQ